MLQIHKHMSTFQGGMCYMTNVAKLDGLSILPTMHAMSLCETLSLVFREIHHHR